jgi:membrane-associated phospholipid phosphatase
MVRKRWWPLLLCYPLAMTFALVYSGEHYMVDVFAGWLYVGVTFAVVWAGERLWAAFRAGRGSAMALVRPVTVAPVTVAEPAIQVAQRAEAAAAERDAWRTSERPRVAQEAAPVEEFG